MKIEQKEGIKMVNDNISPGYSLTGFFFGADRVERDGVEKFYALVGSGGSQAERVKVTPEMYGRLSACAMAQAVTLTGCRFSAFRERVYCSADGVIVHEA